MEPDPTVVAAYPAALPDDPRVEAKRMFGMPCAFVNRQMFFGTFEKSVVARVGPERAELLASNTGMRVFTPMEDRPWRDYVQLDAGVDAAFLKELAVEALNWADQLPPKVKRPKVKAKKAAKKAG